MYSNRFHIIHTNDIHSQFQRWPSTVAKIRSLQAEFREKRESFLTLDIGDHLDRSHFITEGTMGKANVELMNQVGYDYVTIGNNEGMTFSKKHLDQLYDQATFKVLLNNLFEIDGTQVKWALPYTIHKINQIKIGLIGTTIDFVPFYHLLGWKIVDPIKSVTEQLEKLRNQVDVVIVLSHLGLARDQELARSTNRIDLILGAHTHHLLNEGLKIGPTYINHAGKFGENVGIVSIELDEKKHPHISSNCIKVDEKIKAEEASELLHKWESIATNHLAEEVIDLEERLPISWHTESTLGNILAEGLRDWCNTPIAMVNSGQLLGDLPQGKVTKGDLLRICPHPINPCIVVLKGEQIKSILERSLAQEVQQLAIKGYGFRGKILGFLSVAGLKVQYRQAASSKHEIVDIKLNQETIKTDQEYQVATIDMLTFTKVFKEIYQAEHVQYFMPEFLRDVLARCLSKRNIAEAKKQKWKKTEHRRGDKS